MGYLEGSATPTRQPVWNFKHCIRHCFGDTEMHLITNTGIAKAVSTWQFCPLSVDRLVSSFEFKIVNRWRCTRELLQENICAEARLRQNHHGPDITTLYSKRVNKNIFRRFKQLLINGNECNEAKTNNIWRFSKFPLNDIGNGIGTGWGFRGQGSGLPQLMLHQPPLALNQQPPHSQSHNKSFTYTHFWKERGHLLILPL